MEKEYKFRFALVLILVLIGILGCSSSSTPVEKSIEIITPSIKPTVVMPSPSPTPTPILFEIIKDTIILSGPEKKGFEPITNLIKGNKVEVLAKFVDYAKIRFTQDGKPTVGYIPVIAIKQLPLDLIKIKIEEVPWKTLFTLATNEKPIRKENSGSFFTEKTIKGKTSYKDSFEIRVDMESMNPVGLLLIAKPGTSIWWKGQKRIEMFCEKGRFNIHLRDGTSENGCFSLGFPASGTGITSMCKFKLRFDQFGKNVDVYNASNVLLDQIAIENMCEFPGGLFPDGTVRLTNVDLSPNSSVKFTDISFYIPPSGIS
jgi:hypothetical protein